MKYSLNIIAVALLVALSSAQGGVVLSYDAADLALTGDASGVQWAPAVSNGVAGMNFLLGPNSSVITPSSAYFSRSVSAPNAGNVQSFAVAGIGSSATSDFSFELWVKPADLSGNHILFETGGSSMGTSILLMDNTLRFVHTSGGSLIANVAEDLTSTPSDFIQIVGVTDIDTGLILYINGAEVRRSQPKTIGTWGGNNGGQFGGTDGNFAKHTSFTPTKYDGELALARFYDTALSSTEVADAYTSTIPEPATLGLVAFVGGGVLFIRRRSMI